MRGGIFRTFAVVVALSLGATFAPAPVGAATSAATDRLTDPYCDALSDYFTVSVTVELSIQLFSLFSSLPGTTAPGSEPPPDEDTLRAGFYVVVSPKLEAVAAKLSRSGPKILRPLFRQLRDTFAKGVDALSDADIPEEAIDRIANADITAQTSDVGQIAPQIPLDDEKLTELAEGFKADLEELDLTEAPPRAEETFDDALLECGITPDEELDCDKVLSEEDALAILDADEVSRVDDSSACDYTGPEPVDGQTPEVAVVVWRSARTYERVTEPLHGEPLEGIGDEALTIDGFSSDGHDITCGRTLFVVDGDNTVSVALCLGGDDPPVSDDQLAQIADQVLQEI